MNLQEIIFLSVFPLHGMFFLLFIIIGILIYYLFIYLNYIRGINCIALIAAHPLHIIRRNAEIKQTQRFTEVGREIIQRKGMQGLFSGVLLNMSWRSLSAGLVLSLYSYFAKL